MTKEEIREKINSNYVIIQESLIKETFVLNSTINETAKITRAGKLKICRNLDSEFWEPKFKIANVKTWTRTHKTSPLVTGRKVLNTDFTKGFSWNFEKNLAIKIIVTIDGRTSPIVAMIPPEIP